MNTEVCGCSYPHIYSQGLDESILAVQQGTYPLAETSIEEDTCLSLRNVGVLL